MAAQPLTITEIATATPRVLSILAGGDGAPEALANYIKEWGVDRVMATALTNDTIRNRLWDKLLNSEYGIYIDAGELPELEPVADKENAESILRRTYRALGEDQVAQEFFAQVSPEEMAAELKNRNASIDQVATMMRRAASYGYEEHFNAIQSAFEAQYPRKDIYETLALDNYIDGILVDTESENPVEAQYPEGIIKQMRDAGIDTSKLAITALRRGDMELLRLAEKYGIHELPEMVVEYGEFQSVITNRTTPEMVDWVLKQPGIDARNLLLEALRGQDFKGADRIADSMAESVHEVFKLDQVYLNNTKQIDWWMAQGIPVQDLAAKVRNDRYYDENSDEAKHVTALLAAQTASATPAPTPPPFDASAELTKLLEGNQDRLVSDVVVALARKDRAVLGNVKYDDQQFTELFSVFNKRAAIVGLNFGFAMSDGNTAIMLEDDAQVTIKETKDIWLHPHETKPDPALVAKYNIDKAYEAFQSGLPRDAGIQVALSQGMDSTKWPEVTRRGVHAKLMEVETAINSDSQLSPEQKEFLFNDPRIMRLSFDDLHLIPEAMHNKDLYLSKDLDKWFAETKPQAAAAPTPPPALRPAAVPPAAAVTPAAEPVPPPVTGEDAGQHPVKEKETLLKIAKQYQDSLSKIAEEEGLNAAVQEKDREAMARWAFVFAAAHENGMKTAKEANHIVAGASLDLPEEADVRAAAKAMAAMLGEGKKITYASMDQVLPPVTPQTTAVDNPDLNRA